MTYPTTGAITVAVGSSTCSSDYLATAPAASCASDGGVVAGRVGDGTGGSYGGDEPVRHRREGGGKTGTGGSGATGTGGRGNGAARRPAAPVEPRPAERDPRNRHRRQRPGHRRHHRNGRRHWPRTAAHSAATSARTTFLTAAGLRPLAFSFSSAARPSRGASAASAAMSDDGTPRPSGVPRTGVIYVMTEAAKRGYRRRRPDWCNLGQGQPETGPLPGAPPRFEAVAIDVDDQEYAPVAGLWELREAIAGVLQPAYRRGLPSQYSAENVSVSGGGRAALTRAAASLGQVNLGHFLPDYTAYEELLDVFKAFTAIPILLEAERGYAFSVDDLRREMQGRGLSALLLSNPCNPTGKLVHGEELARLGARWRASSTARSSSTSSIRTTSGPGRAGQLADGERRALRRGRQPRSGGHLRRPDQELALPGLARHLDGRPAPGHRRASPAPGSSSTAAARSRCSAPRSRSSTTSTSSPRPRPSSGVFRESAT